MVDLMKNKKEITETSTGFIDQNTKQKVTNADILNALLAELTRAEVYIAPRMYKSQDATKSHFPIWYPIHNFESSYVDMENSFIKANLLKTFVGTLYIERNTVRSWNDGQASMQPYTPTLDRQPFAQLLVIDMIREPEIRPDIDLTTQEGQYRNQIVTDANYIQKRLFYANLGIVYMCDFSVHLIKNKLREILRDEKKAT